MLSNAYFLAKFRFDIAENEPAKNLQKFVKFANFADPKPGSKPGADMLAMPGSGVPPPGSGVPPMPGSGVPPMPRPGAAPPPPRFGL